MPTSSIYPTRRTNLWKNLFSPINYTPSKTAGYDAVIVINENLINEASAALYYSNFLTINGEMDFGKGKYALPANILEKVPTTLNSFLNVRYRCKLLQEPIVDFKANNTVSLHARLRLYIWMMDGLEVKFDADLKVTAPLNYAIKRNKNVEISFKDCTVDQLKITLKGSDKDIANIDVAKLFSGAITSYLKNESKPLSIKLPVFDTQLPYLEDTANNKFKVDVAGIKAISNKEIAIAFNFLGHTGGNIGQLQPFAPNSNIAVAVSQKAMTDTFDFLWNRYPKNYGFSKTFNIDAVTKFADIAFDIQSLITTFAAKLATFGFVEADYTLDKLDFVCTVTGRMKEKPSFSFMTGNRIKVENIAPGMIINLKAIVYYTRRIYVDTSGWIPDKCTPWKDDVKISEKRGQNELFNVIINLSRASLKSCTAELVLGEERNAIEIAIKEFVLAHIFKTDCPVRQLGDKVATAIANYIGKKIIVPNLPKFTVTPCLEPIEITGLCDAPLVDAKKLTITSKEAIVGVNVEFPKIKTIMEPMPKYVGNKNTMEVHRIGCDCIMDTYETHQRGFYSLQKALNLKYDGCKKCLPAYHKR